VDAALKMQRQVFPFVAKELAGLIYYDADLVW